MQLYSFNIDVAVDIRKAFDRKLKAALGTSMQKYNIGRNLAHLIEQLYGKTRKTGGFAPVNGVIRDWFDTTVRVRYRRLLLPSFIVVRVKRDALCVDKGSIGVRRRTVTDLRFADDIDGLLGEHAKLANQIWRRSKTI